MVAEIARVFRWAVRLEQTEQRTESISEWSVKEKCYRCVKQVEYITVFGMSEKNH